MIAGGSLTARNERLLLDAYPGLVIARGAGEATIADILGYWHGDLPLDQVRGIGYRGGPHGKGVIALTRRRTATPANSARDDIWPELDLLPSTFDHQGVAQLETSRTAARTTVRSAREGTRGTWSGTASEALPWILDALTEVFDAHAGPRTLYLVDEEFIGRSHDAIPRALAVAGQLHARHVAWETSCRVDQVVRCDRNRNWHIERGDLWRALISRASQVPVRNRVRSHIDPAAIQQGNYRRARRGGH